MFRHSFMLINVEKMLNNLNYLAKKNNKKIIPVIKANAYGTCDYFIAQLLRKENYSLVAVSSLEEAMNLRKHGDKGDILILGYVCPDDFSLIKENNLSILTYDEDSFLNVDPTLLKDLKVHLKIDTGMHRLGISYNKVNEIDKFLRNHGALVEGIMTHFCCSDNANHHFSDQQFQKFQKAISELSQNVKYIHCANTDASINYNENVSNYMRVGLGMWGYSSFASDLKPAISLYSEIVNIKTIAYGEGVGYGQVYTSEGDGYIAIMPIGYADGLLRKNRGRKVFVGDEMAEIVGNICMDQCFIKTEKKYPLHTIVEIFGEHLKLEDMAENLDTIPYEIITNISDRVARVFINNKGEILFENCQRFS